MADYKRLDAPRIEVEHNEDGGWRWRTGTWIQVGYDFERVSDADHKGEALTRWGALRQARRAIARDERHERLSRKNLSIDTAHSDKEAR